MGVQATGYEKAVSGCPNRLTAYYPMITSKGEGVSAEKLDETIDRLWEEAGEAWLDTILNTLLSHFGISEQDDWFPHREQQSHWGVAWLHLEGSHEGDGRCWKNHAADNLGIDTCLVDMLPTIPLQLAFHSATPGLTSFTCQKSMLPWHKSRMDVLDFTHAPPLQSKSEGDKCVTWRDCQECMMVQWKRRQSNPHGWCLHGKCIYNWHKGS